MTFQRDRALTTRRWFIVAGCVLLSLGEVPWFIVMGIFAFLLAFDEVGLPE